MTTWEINLVNDNEVIGTGEGLFDIPTLRDTFNPFANIGVAVIDDRDGTQYDKFSRGTRVDFQYADGIGFETLVVNNNETESINNTATVEASEVSVGGDLLVGGNLDAGTRSRTTRLQGFVVERREIENNGADQLEIEVYSLDQLLRGNKVSQDTTNKTVETVLENIVRNDTAVTWNASNVTVGDNVTLTRDLTGERVEDALLYLAFISDNERISVNSDIEFEFTPQENTQAPRDIDNTQWFYTDQPEEGNEVINEVRVWYNNGNDKVTVDNGADKLALQDSLGLDDPFSTVKEVSRPDITDIDDAKDVGFRLLEERDTTTPITVTTFGLETANPGDVINVSIPEKGLDNDFEIASITYNWGADETELILIENTGYQDELLVRVVDAVERVELRDIDRTVGEDRITDTKVEALIDVSGSIEGTTFTHTRFTNTARNLVRDAWGGENPIDIATVRIGDDNTSLSRTNTSLENETASQSATETLDGTKAVDYEASFGNTSASEAGIFDSNGDLIARCIVDSSVSATDLTVTISLTVSDNPDTLKSVFTNDGQEAVRDIIANNSPDIVDSYAYGTGTSAVSESDTSLENEVVDQSLYKNSIDEADTDSEWNNVVN
jgi:hypothetical protein